jgi:hypothetical protein
MKTGREPFELGAEANFYGNRKTHCDRTRFTNPDSAIAIAMVGTNPNAGSLWAIHAKRHTPMNTLDLIQYKNLAVLVSVNFLPNTSQVINIEATQIKITPIPRFIYFAPQVFLLA